MKGLIVLASAVLSACAITPPPGGPAGHRVSVNGEEYVLSQLTEATWIATSPGISKPLPASTASRHGLRRAIEKTSGCKVTDSDYSRQGQQFDAQVDCGSGPPN